MKIFPALLLLSLALTACSTKEIPSEEIIASEEVAALEADFEPTQGTFEKDGEGPWNKRILLATSKDGLNFEKTNVVLADQANVPNMVVDEKGWVYLYYSGHTVGEKENISAVAISQDNGETWTHKYLNLNGFEKMALPNDPDVEILEDGTFRLYVTSSERGSDPAIFYADSTDGYNFKKGGTSFEADGWAIDSSTFKVGNLWHQFSLVGNTLEHYHATSEDGKTFTLYEKESFIENKLPYVMANEIQVEDGVRFYAFTLQEQDFISFFSSDGYVWEKEKGSRLSFDPNSEFESSYIKDPAVAMLQDGTYIMAYVTVIP